MIQSFGCDQQGRILIWETGVKEVGFVMFSEIYHTGAISFRKEKEFLRTGGILIERIRKVFN